MRSPIPLPSQDRLRELFVYEPDAGRITWADGRPAFTTLMGAGYWQGTIDGVRYYAHRVIWKMMHGEEPPQIDHRNGDRGDNRLGNLRASCHSMNAKNARRRRDNTSGASGVGPRGRKWRAYIRVSGVQQNLGSYDTQEAAVAAWGAARTRLGFDDQHGAR